MSSDDLRHLSLATALTALAGFVDAVGFLTLRHLFVSFMSGNSTQFALKAGEQSWNEAFPPGALVVVFVTGVVVGRLIATAAKNWRRPAILISEAALLGAAAVLPLSGAKAAVLMALAMGAQNAVLHRAGETKTSLTYVTGTLVSFGEKLADGVSGAGPLTACLPYFSLWAGLVLGGAAGAVVYGALGIAALALPAAASASLAAATALAALGRG